jgi:uncharacterized metal-binding protein
VAKSCLDCTSKACKTAGADCFGLREKSIGFYVRDEINPTVKNSSKLVDNGRAGELSRFQEVVEFCKLQNYSQVGLAYCFGLEPLAETIRTILEEEGIVTLPARCTMGGVKESAIDDEKSGDAISCNPAGQAHFLNERADFVIELGLCLGHDVLFHRELTVPFTVLLVKDRVYGHAPLKGIENFREDQKR